ncbi:nucleoside triphosphate pyrophosphohydrolase [[Mycobacterium] wendilense]|uniref:Nucleoside triphosphate pyrophosphohydrolase n=1 Tax=[Mycobacterium] wendilense TaxID=3064284 RepID=A0ABN9NWA8_9MYCO|nr:nucleoside triphosphate pyrophosphohydrolase [Mycolicibacterium sp. MU0050]CAJ1580280.1 nucleoside triphosphate pyrophosphohydrolase [Mycolicibacterium sp. MU0050]
MTVILVDPRRPTLIPVEAVELLSGEVQYTEEMPIKLPWSLPNARLVGGTEGDEQAAVLVSSDPDHPAVAARVAAGEKVIAAPAAEPGERIVDAVAMMDKLRTDGPWESEQTHDSLRRYLLEETYELFDAVRNGDAEQLREELGDVLLQVLFHARIAQDSPAHPFSIDDVADALVRKLGNRVPAVLAGESISLEDQLAQWEERKAAEKAVQARTSAMDDVPTAQPALALAQKVISRAQQAGLPADLIPAAMLTVTVSPDSDAENGLRSAVLAFMDRVRVAERAIAAARGDIDASALGAATADEWRAAWPADADPEPEPGDAAPAATADPDGAPDAGPAVASDSDSERDDG